MVKKMKPIPATPALSGKDAAKLLEQVNMAPTREVMQKNKMLRSVLENVRKA